MIFALPAHRRRRNGQHCKVDPAGAAGQQLRSHCDSGSPGGKHVVNEQHVAAKPDGIWVAYAKRSLQVLEPFMSVQLGLMTSRPAANQAMLHHRATARSGDSARDECRLVVPPFSQAATMQRDGNKA